ncbi:hypothetical protein [Desulfonema ishimotonii]|uniref:hypothetical protein n=1 Tax=Desulfonema ishimotonii TaxID=45657 RepID=UPI00140D4E6D|nr:hypothetical protein [Desulfonema ishimotonii]
MVRRNFELDILPGPGSETPASERLTLDVAGRLCTPQDVLATGIPWEKAVRPGDYIVFFNCGAYGLSASPVNFLGYPPPVQTLVHTI